MTDGYPQGTVSVSSGCFDVHNLETTRGRRNHVILILIVALTPVIALLVQNCVALSSDSKELDKKRSIRGVVQLSIQTGNVVHRLQIERGTTAFYISSQGDPLVLDKLKTAYNMTEYYISLLDTWPENDDGPDFESVEKYRQHVMDFRTKLDPSTIQIDEAIKFYTDNNIIFISWFASNIQKSNSGNLWPSLVGYHFLVLAKEEAGIERARGSTFFSRGGFDQLDLLKYASRRVLGENYLRQAAEYSTLISEAVSAKYEKQAISVNIGNMRDEIKANNTATSSVERGNQWFQNMTMYINILHEASVKLAEEITQTLSQEIRDLESNFAVSIVVVVLAMLLCPFVIITVQKLTQRIRVYAENLQQKTKDLEIERMKSQSLLYELLPVSVANKLLQNQPVEPESYSSVTIFFSDIVGFTKISSQSTPLEIVNMLNVLYKTFDNNLELYDVYKVETIGDAYMVASGLPMTNGDVHCVEIGHFALDLLDAISNLAVPHMPGETLRLRIGLNTGPVVTGVVGNKMPRYCVFGDTVNTASRMESLGLPHKIQITATTKEGLEKSNQFIFSLRGDIDVKGKGLMTTYWLEGRTTHPKRERGYKLKSIPFL